MNKGSYTVYIPAKPSRIFGISISRWDKWGTIHVGENDGQIAYFEGSDSA